MPAWGFELEFAAPYGVREYLNEIIPNGFVVGTDSTANYGMNLGLELRSNIFRQGLPRNKFKECLDKIKAKNGFVHPYCGFHIHFSDCGRINMEIADSILREKYNWRQRNSYVNDTFGRYRPIRQVLGDHYEIRSFNATLNLRGICQMYKIARKVIVRSGGTL